MGLLLKIISSTTKESFITADIMEKAESLVICMSLKDNMKMDSEGQEI